MKAVQQLPGPVNWPIRPVSCWTRPRCSSLIGLCDPICCCCPSFLLSLFLYRVLDPRVRRVGSGWAIVRLGWIGLDGVQCQKM